MTAEQTQVLERIHALLEDERSLRELRMFGGISIMVNERIIFSVRKDGGLLVRVDEARSAELLNRRGAGPALLGRNSRAMGPGWLLVDPETVADDDELEAWFGFALEYNRNAG